jgi:uncharacterized protein
MKMSWHGRVLLAGQAEGLPLLLAEPLSLWGGLDPQTGRIIDQRHTAVGACVTGRVLILPAGRGSSSASSILLEAVRAGTAPVGIITAVADDGILALGAVVAQEIYGTTLPVLTLPHAVYDDFVAAIAANPTAKLSIQHDQLQLHL